MAKNFTNFQLYAWRGINRQGVETKGVVPAETIESAEAQLRSQGIDIDLLKPQSKLLAMGQFKGIKANEVVIFSRQIATMITADIPLVQALEIVANGIESLSMKTVVLSIYKDVTSGSTLAEALKKFPKQFNNLYCSLVKVGETSGTLDQILNQVASYLERMEVLRGRIKKAMMYPMVVLAVTLIVAVVLLTFIVPQFQQLFQSFGADLPGPTQVVLHLSEALRDHWLLIIGGGVIVVAGLVVFKRRSQGFRNFLNRLTLRLVIFGPLIRKSILARIARTLSLTLSSGIPLVDALECAADVANNKIYHDAILQVRDRVIGGRGLYPALEETNFFRLLCCK